tara:strand:- start:126686 stop:127048 length:363 start_codon:yes stop_codon:yes gene_type:complete
MSDNAAAIQRPDIQEKLLHLGFKACSDGDQYEHNLNAGLIVKRDQHRLEVTHSDAGEEHKAIFHDVAALNTTHLENHIRGIVTASVGKIEARRIKDFPYSAERIKESKAASALLLAAALS